MKDKFLVRSGYVALIVVLLVISFFVGRVLAKPGVANAQDGITESAPDFPNAPNASSFYCTSVTNVASFENRVHLRCSNANEGVIYYAYPNDASHIGVANQILAISNTAFALSKGVWVYYNASSTLNPPGCNIGDCRGLVGVSMVQ